MNPIREFEAYWHEGVLDVQGYDLRMLFEHVMAGHPAVIKNVFPKDQLRTLRDAAHGWGLEVPARPPQTYSDENFHAIESGISPRQKTPHNYHAYNFNHPMELPALLSSALMAVCEPLRRFQNALTSSDAQYEKNESGWKLHPQMIHYPCGGGMFGQHFHKLDPQRIGLILGCSERGVDFKSGGTYFEVEGEIVQSDACHDIGDLLLFRFDQPHGISVIDEDDKIDYRSSRGRWTFVLPYY